MVHVIANVEVAEGCRDQFLAEFHNLVPKVLKEEGCIEYGPAIDVNTSISVQDPPRDDLVTILEKWESIESLVAHLGAAHMIEYRTRVRQFVRRVSLRVLQPA